MKTKRNVGIKNEVLSYVTLKPSVTLLTLPGE